MSLTIVTGGARSGKSTFTEKLAADSGLKVVYLATACAEDEEMNMRINHHRQHRPSEFITIPEPYKPGRVLTEYSNNDTFIIVDCLTMYLSNILLQHENVNPITEDNVEIDASSMSDAVSHCLDQARELILTADQCSGPIAIVTNEVGMGVIPPTQLGRAFQDLSGWANQLAASRADHVYFLISGIPQQLK